MLTTPKSFRFAFAYRLTFQGLPITQTVFLWRPPPAAGPEYTKQCLFDGHHIWWTFYWYITPGLESVYWYVIWMEHTACPEKLIAW